MRACGASLKPQIVSSERSPSQLVDPPLSGHIPKWCFARRVCQWQFVDRTFGGLDGRNRTHRSSCDGRWHPFGTWFTPLGMGAWIWICFRVPMWVFAVGFVSQFVLINCGVAGRHQKLQELLNSLGTYSKTPETQMITKDHSETLSTTVLNSAAAKLSKEMPPASEGANLNTSAIKSREDFFRVVYGTPEGIEYIRKHYGPTGLQQARANFGLQQELEDVRKANEHYLHIRTKARCKVPAARVIRVKDIYPDPSKEYLPRCTVLHRCGDSSGCCDSDAFQCVPSAKQEVALHFYILSVGKHGISYKTGNSIEQLLFVNHTACHCQPVNDLPRLQQDPDTHRPQVGIQLETTNNDHRSKCRECPVPFTSRVYVDGRCGCDCFDRQRTCLRIKRGRDPLPDVERRCVEANYCHNPDCEYGIFDPETGYCPRRHDESARTPPHRSHSSHHRWSFIERD